MAPCGTRWNQHTADLRSAIPGPDAGDRLVITDGHRKLVPVWGRCWRAGVPVEVRWMAGKSGPARWVRSPPCSARRGAWGTPPWRCGQRKDAVSLPTPLAACGETHAAQFSRWGLERRCIPAEPPPHREDWPLSALTRVPPQAARRNSGPLLLAVGGWCGYVGVKTPRLIAPRMRKTRPRAGGGGHSRHPEFGEGAAVTLAWRSVNRAGFRAPARCRAPPGGLPGGRRSKPSPRFFPFGGTRFRGPRGRGAGPPIGKTGRRSHPHCPWRGCTTSRQVACGRRGIVAKLSTVRRGKRVRSRLPDPGSDRVLLAFPEMPGFPNGFSTKCGKCGKPHCLRVRRP